MGLERPKTTYDTRPYMESIAEYRRQLSLALAVAADPFKAPELTVGTARRISMAAWEMEVECAALTNYRHNVSQTIDVKEEDE